MNKEVCACCGNSRPKNEMIYRHLNGRKRYCCSLACEVSWEKANLLGVCG